MGLGISCVRLVLRKGNVSKVSLKRVATEMANEAHALCATFLAALNKRNRRLESASLSLAGDLGRPVTSEETADILAQAIVCIRPILRDHPTQASLAAAWLAREASDWETYVLEESRLAGDPHAALGLDTAHLFEPFFEVYSRQRRKRGGVFFTPQPVARFIVAQVDRLLRDDFGLPLGLADPAAARLQIIDPAAGTGVFLLEVIQRIHDKQRQLWIQQGLCHDQRARQWNDCVSALLPRLVGVELLPAAALVAKLNIALKLAETGYLFDDPGKVNVLAGDALVPDMHSKLVASQPAISIVIGNPPFSSLSTNSNEWIAELVRGNSHVRGYVQAGDERLNERKTWLYDDYVKFIRLAQWHIEKAGCGIVALVTNHGYLDNTTFRLMRHELLRVFPRIQIIDLHGSRKSGEISPSGGRDENVFRLDQGIAIGLFSRPSIPTRSIGVGLPRLTHADLWGTRDDKLTRLAEAEYRPIASVELTPAPPQWRFAASSDFSHPEYEAGWSLTDLMPLYTTAPVTARDHFVIAFTREELCRRIAEFRDLSIPDDEIRSKYFTRTRSARYESGDTRGWKLAAARAAVAADEDWKKYIRRCLYRPFDWRFIFWHPAMIDWPRNDVTKHLIASPQSLFCDQQSAIHNLCLIARRQQLPTQPCTFFWISDGLAIDGVIRSDNRGSESLFPLYRYDSTTGATPRREVNCAPNVLAQLADRLKVSVSPADLIAYIYALFHSLTYRSRYAQQLRGDFPRVLSPSNAALFCRLSDLGRQLIALHLLRIPGENAITADGFSPSKEAADFQVGGYRPLRKWLQPKHRTAADPHYQSMVSAIEQTIARMRQVDAAIEEAGGFPAAFTLRSSGM